jgi:hypothetical protein
MNGRIDPGRTINEVFRIYVDQAGVLLPAALVLFVIEGLVSGILIALLGIIGAILAVIFQLVVNTIYQGMVVQLVADVQDGRRDASVEDLFRSVTGVVVPLILVGLLAGLGIALGLALLIVPGLFLLTIWAVVAPVVVLERPGVIEAFGRSRELVRGNGWQVFFVIVVFFVILLVVSAILGGIGAALGDVGSVIADIVGSVLAAPLVALAAAVLYFQLRGARGETAAPERAVGVRPPEQPVPGAPPPAEPAAPERPAPEQPSPPPPPPGPEGTPPPGQGPPAR